MACAPSERSTWASAQFDQSSLSAWRKLKFSTTHWAHSQDRSDWVDTKADLSLRMDAHAIFLVFTCVGSNKSKMMHFDEKWLNIRLKWKQYYWCFNNFNDTKCTLIIFSIHSGNKNKWNFVMFKGLNTLGWYTAIFSRETFFVAWFVLVWICRFPLPLWV